MATWLGIDIGNVSVKAAVLRSTYRKLSLARIAVAEVEGGNVSAAVRAAVARAVVGQTQAVDAVAVAIEGSRAAIHRLTLPAAAQKQLEDVLTYELEAQIPFDLDSAVFDWRQIERAADAEAVHVVAAVARVEDVRARIELVREATTHEPERVGVGALVLGALVPFVPALGESQTVAIVDMGARSSEVLILEGGEPVSARTLSSGTEGLPATASRLARDISLSFAAHRSRGGDAPARVYLCGGGAFESGAERFLSSSLELPVTVLPEPTLDLTALGADELRDLPKYAKAVALACSLAGRGSGMNLRRGPLAFERGFAWVRERVPMLAGLAATILVSFTFSAWARLHGVHEEHAAFENALGSVTKEVLGTEATSAQDAQDLLAKEAALTDEDPMPHADGFDVMVRLSDAIPSSMKHDIDELDVQKGHVTVRGIVGSIPDAQSIASTLADDKCLSDAKIKSTTQQIGGDRQKYVLEFDVKCPEDVKPVTKKRGESSSASGAGGN